MSVSLVMGTRLILLQHANHNLTDRSLGTMHRIGMDLIHTAQERLASSGEALSDFDFRAWDEEVQITRDDVETDTKLGGNVRIGHNLYHGLTVKGRDLLSLLSACCCQALV